MRLEGKVALVSGGAKGIGEAVVRRFIAEGAAVGFGDVDEAAGQALADELAGGNTPATFMPLDVTQADDWRAAVDFLVATHGRLDILVNNAGIYQRKPIDDTSEEEWDEMIDINMRGVFLCSQAVMSIMKRQQQGRILNMASLAGKVGGIAVGAHYSASKAGVICLTKSFARNLGPYGITVNALAPGPVDTAMIQDWPSDVREDMARQAPLGRIAMTEDVAEPALFLLSDAAKHITGEILDINGGILMD